MSPFEKWVQENLPMLQAQSRGAQPAMRRMQPPPPQRRRRQMPAQGQMSQRREDESPFDAWLRTVGMGPQSGAAASGMGGFFQENPVGRALGLIINTVDAPRAAVNATIASARRGWDEMGVDGLMGAIAALSPAGMAAGSIQQSLTSTPESRQQMRDDFNRRIGFQESTGLADTSLPGWAKGTIGFAGDVATDPLLYVGGVPAAARAVGTGAVRGGTRLARAGTGDVLNQALRGGGRKDIALAMGGVTDEAVARAAPTVPTTADWSTVGQLLQSAPDAQRAQNLAQDIGAELSRQTARRGRGALTGQGLQRTSERLAARGVNITTRDASGNVVTRAVTPDDIRQIMDLDVLFGYGLRIPGRSQGGTRVVARRAAEFRENVAGSIKYSSNDWPMTPLFRQLMNSQENNYNQLLDSLLRGGVDGTENQLRLIQDIGNIYHGRAASRRYAQENGIWLTSHLTRNADIQKSSTKGPRKGVAPTADENALALRQLESTDPNVVLGPFARVIRDTLDKVYNDLAALGVPMAYLPGYLPHVMSKRTRRLFQSMDEDTLITMGLDRRAAFEEVRQWKAGSQMTMPDGSQIKLQYGTITEINSLWSEWFKKNPEFARRLRVRDADKFEFFVSDVVDATAAYIAEAAEKVGRQTIIRRVGQQNPGRAVRMAADDPSVKAFGKQQQASTARAQREMVETEIQSGEETLSMLRGDKPTDPALRDTAEDLGDAAFDNARAQQVKEARIAILQGHGNRKQAANRSRRNANRRADDLAAEADGIDKRLVRLREQLEDAQRRVRADGPDRASRVSRVNQLRQSIDLLEGRRQQALDKAKELRGSLTEEEQLFATAAGQLEELNRVFGSIDGFGVGSVDRFAYETADLGSINMRLEQIGEFVNTLDVSDIRFWPAGKAAREDYGTRSAARIAQREERLQIIQGRVDAIQAMLRDPNFQGVFSSHEARRAAMELEDEVRDFVAARSRRVAEKQRAFRVQDEAFAAFKDSLFVDDAVKKMQRYLDDFGREYAVPPELLQQYQWEVSRRATIMENWLARGGVSTDAARTALYVKESMGKMMNWWKSWALGSPGFVSRNLQGGLFNMFLDGVEYQSVNLFRKAYTQYIKGDIPGVTDPAQGLWKNRAVDAIKTDRTVRREAAARGMEPEEFARSLIDNEFTQAIDVAAATGWGQAPVEVSRNVATAKRRRSALNVFVADNQYTGSIRDLATHSEAIMRGGHAFDVLKNGGSFESAVERVTKFHFNYQDIGQLDRAAKSVIPFWMFYSRNLALQSQVWTKSPQKLNRTYFNAVRNFSEGDPEDRPAYFSEMGLVQTGLRQGGNRLNVGVDLPSLRIQSDISTALPQPQRILADSYPWFKLPMENMFGKNMFYNADFKDEHVRRFVGKDGNYQIAPRTADGIFNNPVMRPLLRYLPGFDEIGGELTVTDRMENFYRQAPLIQRSGGLLFPSERNQANHFGRMISFLTGLQMRPNTPEMQEQARRGGELDAARMEKIQRDRQRAADYARYLEAARRG